MKLLYIANNTEPFQLRKFGEQNIFEVNRKDTLVDIVAYCLMPNHVHLAVSSRTAFEPDPGITRFIHKLCTGYSGYYNRKNDHSGTIWQGPYKEKTADDELSYIRTLISYIHLNPYYGIKAPNLMKEARPEYLREAIEYSKKYEYSSFKDYLGDSRQQTPILCARELALHRGEASPRET